MAKRKARYVTLPPCQNVECHGHGYRTKRNGEYIWRCGVCEAEWPREERYDA